MKPSWDQLMEEYAGSTSALIADVDCEGDGQALCEAHGVEGYPTIKWGDPANLQEYEGDREYEDLKKFADENLGPQCSPSKIDLCDEGQKALIEKYSATDKDVLIEQVEKIESEIQAVSDDFDKAIEKLQAEFEKLEKEKTEKLKGLENSSKSLSVMKSVVRHKYPGALKEASKASEDSEDAEDSEASEASEAPEAPEAAGASEASDARASQEL